MFKKVTTIGLVLVLVAGLGAATAESVTRQYNGSAGFTTSAGLGFGGIVNVCALPDLQPSFPDGCSVGGVIFAAHADGLIPGSVDINDASGGPVSVVICQDTQGDGLCEYGSDASPDPWWAGCDTNANLADSPTPFRADLSVAVFINLFDDTCPGIGSGGSVTLTYEE